MYVTAKTPSNPLTLSKPNTRPTFAMWTTRQIELERVLAIVALRRRLPIRHQVTPWALENGWRVFDPARDRQQARERYRERRAAGLCTQCGKASDGKTHCKTCRCLAKKRRKTVSEYNSHANLCKCGKDPGPEHKTCFDCRKKSALFNRRKRSENV